MADQDVLYRLKIDLSGAKPQFEELKRTVTSIGDVKPTIEFKNLSSLRAELSQLEHIRDNAFDFKTATVAAGEVKKIEKEIETLNKGLGQTKGHQSTLDSLKEGFSGIGKVIGVGAIGFGFEQGLEKIFSAGEARIRSLEDYRIALRQSGTEEKNLGAAQAAGAKIVDDLSNKYARNKEEIRSVVTQVTGLGGISGEQSKRVAEIGIAFEQIGVPARSFKQLLAGAGGVESLGALESIRLKFPAVAKAIEGAGTAGQKVDAIFKAITPTLEGMKEAADGPIGKFDRLKNSLDDTTKSFGAQFVAEGANFLDLIKNTGNGINKVSAESQNFFSGAAQSIGNLVGLVSDVDKANSKAAGTLASAKTAFDEYGTSITDVDKKISQAQGQNEQIARLDELSKKTKLTAADQSELSKLTKELGDRYPQAADGVNKLTGDLNINIAKLKEAGKEESALAGADKKKLIEENVRNPLRDLLPAIDAQKAKLAEMRAAFDNAIQSGDKDKILSTREAYDKQREAVKATQEQITKNVTALKEYGVIGKASVDDVSKGLGFTKDEAAKIVPTLKQINDEQDALKKKTDDVKQSVEGLAAEFSKAAQEAKQKFETDLGALDDIDLKIQNNLKRRKAASAEERTQIDKDNTDLITQRKDLFQKTLSADKDNDSIQSISRRNAALFERKEGVSQFEVKLKQFTAEADQERAAVAQHEAQLATVRADEFKKGLRRTADETTQEKQKKINQDIADFLSERERLRSLAQLDADENVIGLQPNLSKKGHEAEDLATLQSKVADLTTKIANSESARVSLKPVLTKEDLDKANRNIGDLIDQGILKDVELGIRPQTDKIDAFERKIADLKKQEADLGQLELKFSAVGDIVGVFDTLQKILTIDNQIKDAEGQINITRVGFAKTLRDAQIGGIEDVADREHQALLARQADELAWLTLRKTFGPLTKDELDLEKALEAKHLAELLDLNKKYEKDKLTTQREFATGAKDFIIGQAQKIFDTTGRLSKEDLDQRRLDLDKREGDLKTSLSRGEISEREYNIAVAKLAKDRSDLESSQQGNFVKGAEEAFKQALGKAGDYFSTLAFNYILDSSLSSATEATKTAAAEAGSAARIAALQIEIDKLREKIGVNIGDAASAGAEGAAGLPFPFNIAAAIAAATAISLGVQAVVKAIGFETGGIGLIGEKGPEVIAPMKDFSQFASQLVMQTVAAMKISGVGPSNGRAIVNSIGPGRINVNVTGRTVADGRTMVTTLRKEQVGRVKEIAGDDPQSLHIGGFTG